MTTLRRRQWLAGLPGMALVAARPLQAQPRADMTASTPGEEQGEVQVGAGTDAAVTTGSSGPQKKSAAAPPPPPPPPPSTGQDRAPATRPGR